MQAVVECKGSLYTNVENCKIQDEILHSDESDVEVNLEPELDNDDVEEEQFEKKIL